MTRSPGRRGALGAIIVLLLLVCSTALPFPMSVDLGTVKIDTADDQKGEHPRIPPAVDIVRRMQGMDGTFLENIGQNENPDVVFSARGFPLSAGLTSNGAVFTLVDEGSGTDTVANVFRLIFEGCNDVTPRGHIPSSHHTNFIIGDDPEGWVLGAVSFREVWYDDMYDGIDLVFYFNEGMLKYDLVLDAGADHEDISISYSGVESIEIDKVSGDLVIHTAAGSVRDRRPIVLASRYGEAVDLEVSFVLREERKVGFDLPWNAGRHLPFVIDPGIQFSTLIGGSGAEEITSIDLTDEGDIIAVGWTDSINFPTTQGSPWPHFRGGSDCFLLKMDPTGSDLLYSTYFGGIFEETASDVLIRDDGTIIVIGNTDSVDFPVTDDAINNTWSVSESGFLVMFDPKGTELLYGTFLGEQSRALDIERSKDGTFYILGCTDSNDFPTTPDAHRPVRRAGRMDLDSFIMRLDNTCRVILNSTFLGGSSNELYQYSTVFWPEGYGLGLGDDGSVYVGGVTWSKNFPITNGTLQEGFKGTGKEGFITKLDPDLTTILASTFLGGSSDADVVRGIEVGSNGTVYATGVTESKDFHVTPEAICGTLTGPMFQDAFLVMMDDNLSTVQYGTYLGGMRGEMGEDVSLGHHEETLYVLGVTKSTDLHTTPGAYDCQARGDADHCLWGFDLPSLNLTYATYIGNGGKEGSITFGDTMAVDEEDVVYFGAWTLEKDLATDYPTTEGAFCRTHAGFVDSTLVKIDPTPCDVPFSPTDLVVNATMVGAHLNWTVPRFNGARLQRYVVYKENVSDQGSWDACVTLDAPVDGWFDNGAIPGMWHTYKVAAVNTAGEGVSSEPASDIFRIVPSAPMNLTVEPDPITGTVTLRWSPPLILSDMEVVGYRIYMGLTVGTIQWHANISNELTFSVNIDPARLGVAHFFQVSAVNVLGEGPASNLVETIPYGPPTPPTGAAAEAGDNEVTLTWRYPRSSGGSTLAGFKVYRKTGETDWHEIMDLDIEELSCTDATAVNGIRYHYQITALNEMGIESAPTDPMPATPMTYPTEPLRLLHENRSREVLLSWDEPLYNGGGEIIRYWIFYRPQDGDEFSIRQSGPETSFPLTGLTNGVTYQIKVCAENSKGLGPTSDLVTARPMGLPGAPLNLTATANGTNIDLSWSPPKDWGGSTSLTFHIQRRQGMGAAVDLTSLVDELGFTDTATEERVQYVYIIRAENEKGIGIEAELNFTITTVPGPVLAFRARSGDGHVLLSWSPPVDDGGEPLTSYVILRGGSGDGLVAIEQVHHSPYNDTNVTNGGAYYYSIKAVNGRGEGEAVPAERAEPLGPPGTPQGLALEVVDGHVRITWRAPDPFGRLPVTGYRLYKGETEGDMGTLIDLGTVTSYTDEDVVDRGTYRYMVASLSGSVEGVATGPQEITVKIPTPTTGEFPWWLLALALLVVVGVGALYVVTRRREAEVLPEEAPVTDVVAVVDEPTGHVVEQAYVVYRDGRLIAECSREECRIADADLASSMLIAIQGIVQDGLERSGTLEGIKYGDNNILMASGDHVNLAVVIYGAPDEQLRTAIRDTVEGIEDEHPNLADWTGELAPLAGIEDMVMPLIESTLTINREDVGGVDVVEGVSLHSAIGFHHGYVRLEAVVSNNTEETLADASIELHYDEDMLRLERAEPDSLAVVGDRVVLGNVKTGEVRTVAFLFDPQICHGTHIDGTLSYYDTEGEYVHVQMARRHADVVCPIFFTKENANTAMLRRLIEDKLHQTDHRVFVYPNILTPREIMRLGRKAMGSGDLQTVREYEAKGPPYEGEVWYYGETKVKGYQMVMRVGVVQRWRVMEVFAASTAMEPVTGFIAEFRREVDRIMREEHSMDLQMELSRDDELKRRLRSRQLMIERDGWDEPDD